MIMRRPLIPIVKSALVLGIVMISIFLSCKKKNPDPPVNILRLLMQKYQDLKQLQVTRLH